MERAHLLDADEVLVELRIEAQQVVDGGLRVLAEQLDGARVPFDGAGGHLVARGIGHHPGVRLVTDAQAVLGQEGSGVGVVGEDHRLDPLGQLVVRARGLGTRTFPSSSPAADNASRTREASSAVALVVKVSPSTWSACT